MIKFLKKIAKVALGRSVIVDIVHIDLNSSIPTIASLDYFWSRLLPGGLLLLDDFAWPGYEETRVEVERWCNVRELDILQFPTGQALITRR